MSHEQRLPGAARALLYGAMALGALAAASAIAAQPGAGPLPIPPGVALKSWQANGSDGRYVLQVIQGRAPKSGKQIIATVTSDTDCDADAQGLSHCHNNLKLANGTQITVIDSHNMHQFRCLGEGDQLTLKAVGTSWTVATLTKK